VVLNSITAQQNLDAERQQAARRSSQSRYLARGLYADPGSTLILTLAKAPFPARNHRTAPPRYLRQCANGELPRTAAAWARHQVRRGRARRGRGRAQARAPGRHLQVQRDHRLRRARQRAREVVPRDRAVAPRARGLPRLRPLAYARRDAQHACRQGRGAGPSWIAPIRAAE